LFQQFSWKTQIYDEKLSIQSIQFKVVYTQLVCRESPRKTAKDGTPILLKTCCFNDIEQNILVLPEACRCRTTPRNADSSAGYLSL
jgi:hypothetical protein